jgi:hypothetical protein
MLWLGVLHARTLVLLLDVQFFGTALQYVRHNMWGMGKDQASAEGHANANNTI